MRRIYMLFLCFMVIFSLLGCQSSEQKSTESKDKADEKLTQEAPVQKFSDSKNGLKLALEKKTYTKLDNEVTVTINIQNNSDIPFVYGKANELEKNIDGTWYLIPFKSGMGGFEDVLLSVKPHTVVQEEILLNRSDNELSPGKYRIVKSFNETPINNNGVRNEHEEFFLAAPFEVIK
ncbi:immunoglobulin-like domain-containing protein [Pseudobacillus sp. 179-B 2D1 NHS]|uniref:immunoglobulin-like domain-containing protein n=1 Tax=Pseudobacillus sp. 179-B 2D1 NHS TaxID=3374292 RepID=UPI00387A320F